MQGSSHSELSLHSIVKRFNEVREVCGVVVHGHNLGGICFILFCVKGLSDFKHVFKHVRMSRLLISGGLSRLVPIEKTP